MVAFHTEIENLKVLVGRLRGLAESLRQLVDPNPLNETASKPVATGDEITIQHPRERHGLYIRNGGIVDMHSYQSVVGVSTAGITLEAPVIYLGGNVVVRTDQISIDAPSDGYLLSGRRLNPKLVDGLSVRTGENDAEVLVTPGSLKSSRSIQTRPVMVGQTPMEAVRLKDLLPPEQFTYEPDEPIHWIDEMISILSRSGSEKH